MKSLIYKISIVIFACLFLFIVKSCKDEVQFSDENRTEISKKLDKTIFTLLDENTLDFVNELKDTREKNIQTYDYFNTGGGVAVGDINNDGLLDVYLTGNLVANKLFINKGNLQFEDVTKKAGVADESFWSTGANMFDINNDGWLDIYVCHSGSREFQKSHQNHLYINNQDGTFTESAKQYGLIENTQTSQVAQIDYDLDGDLDLYLCNHVDFFDRFKRKKVNEKFDLYEEYLAEGNNRKECSNILFENQGNNKFIDVTEKAGIYDWGYGLAVVVSDLNKDNLPDIYVANDFFVPDFMYYNNGDGTFSEKLNDKVGHISQFSMGCDIADFNNDTWPDIAIVDMTSPDRIRNKTLMPSMNEFNFRYYVNQMGYQEQYMFNAFQVNNGNGTFSNINHLIGVASTDWSWSSLFADFDNDGDKDYLITNGVRQDSKNRDNVYNFKKEKKNTAESMDQRVLDLINTFPSVPQLNYLYENKGNYEFEDVSSKWGFTKKGFSNGAAYADFDNDGDLDLVLNNVNDKAHIYKNNSIENKLGNFLSIKFTADPKNLNSTVLVFTDETVQHQEFNPTRGYYSSMQHALHFGVGKSEKIDSVVVNWLNGKSLKLFDIDANQVLEISDEKARKKPFRTKDVNKIFTTIDPETKGLNLKHTENRYSDFNSEVLLPHMESRNGPHVSVADINDDGLEDVFIGGAHNQLAKLFMQNSNGKFIENQQSIFNQHKKFEDIGSIFFDYDKDNDLDLYVVSGGNEARSPIGPILHDRLYENDGKGNFSITENVIPIVNTSGGKVKAADYDNDGDLDLLVAGRITPKNYPIPTKTTILENQNGKFIDVSEQLSTNLKQAGLITSIEWIDFNLDGKLDILYAGEWSNIEILEQTEEGTFKRKTKEYFEKDQRGWWFSMAVNDFDQDGDMDIVAGNLGLNNKFHASTKKPFDIYFNDFDGNGINDIVLAKTDNGEQYPMRGKDCSTEQMPFIKDKFPTYEGFANAKLEEILSPEKLDKSLHYSITDFSSAYFENDNGVLKRKQLPIEAQFAPIQDMLICDINNDGFKDLISGGNLFDTEVETASYDAGTGNILLNDQKGFFKNINFKESGLLLNKNLRDIDWINIGNEKYLIVANNRDVLQLYKLNK